MKQKYNTIIGILILIGITLLFGCTSVTETETPEKTDVVDGNVPTVENENVPEKGSLDCGFEENIHGQGYNEEARNCFYNAFLECKEAKFKVTHSTVEGDLITNIFTQEMVYLISLI